MENVHVAEDWRSLFIPILMLSSRRLHLCIVWNISNLIRKNLSIEWCQQPYVTHNDYFNRRVASSSEYPNRKAAEGVRIRRDHSSTCRWQSVSSGISARQKPKRKNDLRAGIETTSWHEMHLFFAWSVLEYSQISDS